MQKAKQVIVIGGGASLGWDLFMPSTLKAVNDHAHRISVDRVKIVHAELGDDAGIMGVAKLGFQAINSDKSAIC